MKYRLYKIFAVIATIFLSLYFIAVIIDGRFPSLSLIILFSILYTIWIIPVKFLGRAESADKYLKKIIGQEKELCLVLRPFGKDGYTPFSNLTSGFLFKRFLNLQKGATIEQVIEVKAKSVLNVETVAVVDPNLTFIPQSPKYINTSHKTWEWVVFDLLKHSLILFIIVPPNQEVRKPLRWEVAKAIQLGLLGRLAIILPPMNSQSHQKVLTSIKEELFFLSPLIEDLPPDTVAIYPKENEELFYWIPEKKKNEDIYNSKNINKVRIPLTEYSSIINEICIIIKQKLRGTTFVERHLHLNKEYEEFDYDFTNTYLELLLKKPKDPFNLE